MKNNFIESIKEKKRIELIYNSKKNIWTKNFKISYLKNNDHKIFFVIFVNKKKFKLAVKRNKIKRQIRNILFTYKKNLGFDIGVSILPNYTTENFAQIKTDLFNSLDILKIKDKEERQV
ncbi:MAG: ribonuclease P protein component [Mycoplasmataceae bacterium]|jgi:ribonuclease P protein component|nr:ribonuclease P protein component [Mycoplasmataceae bacterium]